MLKPHLSAEFDQIQALTRDAFSRVGALHRMILYEKIRHFKAFVARVDQLGQEIDELRSEIVS